jgi:hypothetical protein
VSEGPDLDLLADYAAGVLDGTPQAAAVAERIAADPAWAELHAALLRADEAVRADLAALPAPPIPADIAARLDEALSAERAGSTHGAAVVPLRRRRWYVAAGSVAAGVALLAAGAFGIQLFKGPSASDTAAKSTAAAPEPTPDLAHSPLASPPKAAPGAGPEIVSGLIASGRDYREDTLQAQVKHLVDEKARGLVPDTDKAAEQTSVPAPLRRLTAPVALANCLAALGADARPLAVDYARFDGAPAVVIVLPALSAGEVEVAVVGAECGQSGSDVKLRSNVDR